ncbi:unnamed protein product [Lampetra planeri]
MNTRGPGLATAAPAQNPLPTAARGVAGEGNGTTRGARETPHGARYYVQRGDARQSRRRRSAAAAAAVTAPCRAPARSETTPRTQFVTLYIAFRRASPYLLGIPLSAAAAAGASAGRGVQGGAGGAIGPASRPAERSGAGQARSFPRGRSDAPWPSDREK